jgi:phage-related protein
MTGWEIVYFSDDVQEAIAAWPVGIRAYYARLTERMRVFGPNLGMPFTRSMGQGLFEIRARGKEGLGRAFFCTVVKRKIRRHRSGSFK